jgi:hypothetical protein
VSPWDAHINGTGPIPTWGEAGSAKEAQALCDMAETIVGLVDSYRARWYAGEGSKESSRPTEKPALPVRAKSTKRRVVSRALDGASGSPDINPLTRDAVRRIHEGGIPVREGKGGAFFLQVVTEGVHADRRSQIVRGEES